MDDVAQNFTTLLDQCTRGLLQNALNRLENRLRSQQEGF